MNDAPVPAAKDVFATRLAGWFDWREAIALSSALDAAPVDAPRAPVALDAVVDDVRRVRASLDRLTADPAASPRPGRSAALVPVPEPAVDFATFRQRYIAAQNDMQADVAALRQRLRVALGRASPALAALAALDAVMEQVVGAREQALLADVPRALGRRFAKCVAPSAESSSAPASAGPSSAGPFPAASSVAASSPAAPSPRLPAIPDPLDLQAFARDLQTVLRAELDLRWGPITALLDALRRSPPLSS